MDKLTPIATWLKARWYRARFATGFYTGLLVGAYLAAMLVFWIGDGWYG